MEYDLPRIREYFRNDRFATNAGIQIDSANREHVVCSMTVGLEHQNAGGGIQGGAIFTLADLAFAVHCNLDLFTDDTTGISVGQSCSISFLKPCKGSRLIATSTCKSKGRTMSVFSIEIQDDLGTHVAIMTGNSFTTQKPAKPEG
jgi:acyl-CoA thioesterase